jgi:hypothetical protein
MSFRGGLLSGVGAGLASTFFTFLLLVAWARPADG